MEGLHIDKKIPISHTFMPRLMMFHRFLNQFSIIYGTEFIKMYHEYERIKSKAIKGKEMQLYNYYNNILHMWVNGCSNLIVSPFFGFRCACIDGNEYNLIVFDNGTARLGGEQVATKNRN